MNLTLEIRLSNTEFIQFYVFIADVLLASGSRDRSFRIWNAYKREVVASVRMPNKIAGGLRNWAKTGDVEKQAKNWITLLWLPWDVTRIVTNYHS